MEHKTKKGMTLVEVIVAIAILGILSVSILGIFSSSFSNIFSFGRKSSALQEAQSLIDKIYERASQGSYLTTADVQTMIADVLNREGYSATQYSLSSTYDQLSTPVGSEHIRYFVGDETLQSNIPGFPVSVLVFSSDNKQNALLTTFIVKGGS